ncbi:MAG: nitrous oxide reductase family maturation protein NosD [Ferruginibacter sp.]
MKTQVLILFCLFSFMKARARVIEVGPGKDHNSIQQALAESNPGDTVLVIKAIYREGNIIVMKPVCLIGTGYPVLDGEGRYEILSIKSDNVIVSGFHIRNSGQSGMEDYAGIKMYQCKNVLLENNLLDNTFFGIYAQYCNNCVIRYNRIQANKKQEQQSGNGIHCWKSDRMMIQGNRVEGHRDGIYFEFVSHSTILKNISVMNIRYGLHFMFSNDDIYLSNTFRNNGAGVAVMFSSRVKMYRNLFEENWGDAAYGLLLKEISDSDIQQNEFVKNTSGIHLEGASRILLLYNTFRSNGWAMRIQASCMDITVYGNNFNTNSFDVATNGSLVLNRFNGNYWDKYQGYDINRDGIGDVAYRPVSMYSMITEKNPSAMLLFRSLMASLLDKTERVLPSLTPENLKDDFPAMKKIRNDYRH